MSRPTKSCDHCSAVFEKDKRLDWKQWAARRYCSQDCTGKASTILNASRRPSVRQKFEANFDRTEGCWEWKGTIDGYGYGVLDHNRRRYRGHVLALEYDGRPVLEGQVGCHHCDNPRCVRPSHLYPGTPLDNVNDAVVRDRIAHGVRNYNAKLTPADVQEMRKLDLPFAEIGRRFGVSRPTAAKAVKGQSWRRVQ